MVLLFIYLLKKTVFKKGDRSADWTVGNEN